MNYERMQPTRSSATVWTREHTLRISGTVAKNLAIFIAAVMKDQKKDPWKDTDGADVKGAKPMKFFSVPKDRLREFAQEAKSKGLLYVIIRDKKHPDLSEIMVFARTQRKSTVCSITCS